MIRTLVIAAVASLVIAAPAHGEEAKRPIHFAAGIGGFAALTGPVSHGTTAEFEIYPGDRLGRFGLGFYYRGFEDSLTDGMFMAGLAFEAGAARPRFTLGLHGEIGYDWAGDQPVIGGGIRAVLTVLGPLAISAGGAAHLFYDGVDSRLAFSFTGTIGVMR